MLQNELFKFEEGVVSRWASHENPDGASISILTGNWWIN